MADIGGSGLLVLHAILCHLVILFGTNYGLNYVSWATLVSHLDCQTDEIFLDWFSVSYWIYAISWINISFFFNCASYPMLWFSSWFYFVRIEFG
jgi:hypothetical protein